MGTQRHLKDETHSWRSSEGVKLAKYCTQFLRVFISAVKPAIFTSLILSPVLQPIVCICNTADKDPHDLGLCFGRGGCE